MNTEVEVGTYFDLTHLNKHKPAPKKRHDAPVRKDTSAFPGTRVLFVDYLDSFDIVKKANNMLVLQPRTV